MSDRQIRNILMGIGLVVVVVVVLKFALKFWWTLLVLGAGIYIGVRFFGRR